MLAAWVWSRESLWDQFFSSFYFYYKISEGTKICVVLVDSPFSYPTVKQKKNAVMNNLNTTCTLPPWSFDRLPPTTSSWYLFSHLNQFSVCRSLGMPSKRTIGWGIIWLWHGRKSVVHHVSWPARPHQPHRLLLRGRGWTARERGSSEVLSASPPTWRSLLHRWQVSGSIRYMYTILSRPVVINNM